MKSTFYLSYRVGRTVSHGDVVIIPAVDRLSRDTTDLLVIARDLQKAGTGLRSLAEPVVDTTSDFAELVLAMLSSNADASTSARRTALMLGELWDASELDAAQFRISLARRPPREPPNRYC